MRRINFKTEAKSEIEKAATEEVKNLLCIAKKNNYKVPEDVGAKLTVKFNLTSIRVAGQAQFTPWDNELTLRYHTPCMTHYKKDYFKSTIPHEVAHILQYINYPDSKPHGNSFKLFMRLFKSPLKRCHNYNLRSLSKSTVRKRKTGRKYLYKCRCSEHMISSIRHKRIVQGISKYYCKKCGETIIKKD